MKKQTDKELEDYFKINHIRKLIEIEKSNNDKSTITQNYLLLLKSELRLMKEAQEFGRQKAQKGMIKIEDVEKMIDETDWTKVLDGTTFSIQTKPYEDEIWGFDTSMKRADVNIQIQHLLKQSLKELGEKE